MRPFAKLIDLASIGAASPIRRLIAYYLVLVLVTSLLLTVFPALNVLFSGERLDELATAPRLLQDGLGDIERGPSFELSNRATVAIVTVAAMLGAVLLMLPVTWVYMTAQRTRGYSQPIVQTLVFLPLVVAGIVLIVRNSLALAFSLAGIVAGVRFRNALKDPRDAVFIFCAIGVGLAAGVQAMTVALLLSITFSFVVLFLWRSDYGRSVLEPSPASQWAEPLQRLTEEGNGEKPVPDRDLMLALSPSDADALAQRFERVRSMMGAVGGKRQKPRYNAVLWATTNHVAVAQAAIERVLSRDTKRWKLDEVVTNEGKPSELYYLVRLRKGTIEDQFITDLRAEAGPELLAAEVEVQEELAKAED